MRVGEYLYYSYMYIFQGSVQKDPFSLKRVDRERYQVEIKIKFARLQSLRDGKDQNAKSNIRPYMQHILSNFDNCNGIKTYFPLT